MIYLVRPSDDHCKINSLQLSAQPILLLKGVVSHGMTPLLLCIGYNENMPKLWFKAKRYGYGWYPATWEGWLVLSIYIVLVLAFSLTVDDTSPPREIFFTCILPVALLTTILIRIAYKKGEKARWSWGGKDTSDTS